MFSDFLEGSLLSDVGRIIHKTHLFKQCPDQIPRLGRLSCDSRATSSAMSLDVGV